LNADTGVPPIATLVTIGSLKLVPLMTITHPAGPLVVENDEMVVGHPEACRTAPTAETNKKTELDGVSSVVLGPTPPCVQEAAHRAADGVIDI
jgi:hypothetical protein